MTISNETKVGSLTAIAIVMLILGFNFLKGKSLGVNNTQYLAVFHDLQGLTKGNPVVINGKEIGTVYQTNGGKDMREMKVTINMKEEVNIPDDSYAVITKSFLGSVQLEIKLGDSKNLKKDGDSIRTIGTADLIGDAMKKLDPVLYQVTSAVKSLDTLLGTVNSVFDPNTKNNIRATMENLNKTTAALAVSSASLQGMLNTQTGSIAKTVDNLNSFTGALKNNNDKLTQTMANVETATGKFAKLDLQATLTNLDGTVSELKGMLAKANSDKGTMGLLMNDPRLYNNLNATSNKLNLLLDDLRLHPKRYINISVFGKKDKSGPLMVPLPDTVNAPYTNQ
ncbi:MAG: MCE family protein [Chitinophagaceae bacterium]|nr:MCE family protein [Chitinophagaceae bacterium]